MDHGQRHRVVGENLPPFAERLVGGDQQGSALVSGTDELDDAASLRAASGGNSRSYAFAEKSRDEVRLEGGDGQVPGSLKTGGGKAGQSYPEIASAMAVRQLTPRECERLQGFPDDYALVEYRGKPAADGPRYRALGNSMAVPVMRWVGERIAEIEALLELDIAAE